MTDVMEDGAERVFRNDAAKKKNYTFAVLKDIVSPPGSASLKARIQNALNEMQPNITVTIKKTGQAPITIQTDVDGVALFENTDPGKYEGDVVRADGTVVHFEKEIDTSVDARVTVTI